VAVVVKCIMYSKLLEQLRALQNFSHITEDRKIVLQPLIDFVQHRMSANEPIVLHFICTHNARRSQLAQVWAQTAAAYYGVPQVYCYSGGVTVTALYPGVVTALLRQGFEVDKHSEHKQWRYEIKHTAHLPGIMGFSKKYDHQMNPSAHFAAIMTCGEAADGCPYVPGAIARIALLYQDPKEADNTEREAEVYEQKSKEIAAEMCYVFSNVVLKMKNAHE